MSDTPKATEEARPKIRRDAMWHIQCGLVFVGFIGAVCSGIVLKWIQAAVDADHPLNSKYRDAYLWVPGAFLIAGPLLGLAYYALFADAVENTGEPDRD